VTEAERFHLVGGFVKVRDASGGVDRHHKGNLKLIGESKKENDMTSKVRVPDDWQAGDMAYCLNGEGVRFKGDLIKVKSVDGQTLCFGEAGTRFIDRKQFARVLTPDEIRVIPSGTELVCVRNSGHYVAGQHLTTVIGDQRYFATLLYALISLPNPERDERIKRMENELSIVETSAKKLRNELKEMKS